MQGPSSVLFACNFNAVRSPMAEAIAKHLYGHWLYVDSAGVRKGTLDPFMVSVMDEIGIDIAKHNPKRFDELEDSSFDLIVSLTPEAQHGAVDMTHTWASDIEYWPTQDPTLTGGSREQRLDSYRQVRDWLFERIKKRFDTGRSTMV